MKHLINTALNERERKPTMKYKSQVWLSALLVIIGPVRCSPRSELSAQQRRGEMRSIN